MNAATFPFASVEASRMNDEVLGEALRACAQQSVPALRRLYEVSAPRLLGLLVQMLGDREQAEALLQQCYLAIWQQASSFNPARSRPRTWLLSVVRQQAIDHLRAHPQAPAEEVDAGLQLAAAALDVQESFSGQRLLRLAFLTGRTPPEIARAMGESAADVRHGIRAALFAMVQEQGE
jgi:DNA-directed RNA polymerase specialized sigma24 family protein